MQKMCPECSDAPIPHALNKWTVFLDYLLRKIFEPVSKRINVSFISRFLESSIPPLFFLLEKTHLGGLALVPGPKDSMRTKLMWEEAKRRGILVRELYIFKRPIHIFIAEWRGQRIIFEGLPRVKEMSDGAEWMDDKGRLKDFLQKHNLPHAKGGSFFSWSHAREMFEILEKPVIVKPSIGSRSRHTRIHINSEKELKAAFLSAKKLSPWVIVEEELQGDLFRISLVGGKVAGILRRDPPIIFGDGIRTVRELIVEENKNPLRQGVFHEVPLDDLSLRELLTQGLSFDSVPERGKKIRVHGKVGRSQGGTNSNKEEGVHPENIIMFEKLAKDMNESLIGVDFIISDMKKSWKEQDRCGIIECNAVPFLDLHHMPYEGKAVDAMSKLWDAVFSNPSLAKNSTIEI